MPFIEYMKTPAGKAAHLAANKRYRQKNKLKLAAHNAVQKALMRGKLSKWPVCSVPDCCETKLEAHHADYSRPLDVIWLCNRHHVAVHNMVRGDVRNNKYYSARPTQRPLVLAA